jgi:pantothenate kinase
MSDISGLVRVLKQKAGGAPRFMVAIAGAPGSGKSTLAHNLAAELVSGGESAIVVPMDGFHFDDAVLNARGHRPRKGAPFTFDVRGFETLLMRIRAREPEVAIAVFDRSLELSRAAADIVDAKAKFVLVEGNYLLLAKDPWSRLRPLFDFALFIDVPREELERRLILRWLDHGFDVDYAKNWVASNDLLNIDEVRANLGGADLTVTQS